MLFIDLIDVYWCLILLFNCVVTNFKTATENRHNQASFNLHTSLLCQFVKVLAGCFGALQDTLKALSRYDDLGVPKDPIQMVPTKALLTWANMTSAESLKIWFWVHKMCEMSFEKMNKKTNETRQKVLKRSQKSRNGIWFAGSCESCCAKGKETQHCQLTRHLHAKRLPLAICCHVLRCVTTCYC